MLGTTILLAGSTNSLPAALAKSTLQAATTGMSVSPAVAALMGETMRIMLFRQLESIGTVVIMIALLGSGTSLMVLRPQAASKNCVQTNDDKPLSVEKHSIGMGTLCPKASLAIGALKHRAIGALFAVTSDGKSIVSVRRQVLSASGMLQPAFAADTRAALRVSRASRTFAKRKLVGSSRSGDGHVHSLGYSKRQGCNSS